MATTGGLRGLSNGWAWRQQSGLADDRGSPKKVPDTFFPGLAENLPDASSLLTISGLSVTLGASTNYYLVALGTTLTRPEGSPSLRWDVTNVITSNAYASTTSGSSWSGPRSNNFIMSVTAVPEPSSGIMIAAGLAAWAMLRRRR